ncbi:MAG: RcnB family protein [Caulobacterales bacterium]|nr:RcnB family protein [Caulobacterales bacterium]
MGSIAAAALSVLASAGVAEAQSYPGRPGGYQGQGGYGQGQGQGQGGYQGGGYGQDQGDYDRRDDRRDERRNDRYDRRDERRDDRYDRRENRQESRWERRAERRYNAGRYHGPRGYAHRQWRRGQYLPPAYRGRDYQVDYRYYRLPPPPRGYQYTRVNDDVVMTAIATGLIASIVFEMFQ